MERTTDTIPIYTIGYGSRSIVELIEVLQQHQVAYLIDVRSVPYSRYKPEFSKKPLANELEQQRYSLCVYGRFTRWQTG